MNIAGFIYLKNNLVIHNWN